MKKLIVLAALALGLAACNVNLNPNVATPNQVLIAANAFDAAEATAANYLTLPLCPAAKVCRTQAISQQLVTYIKVGRSARDQLLADVKGDTPAPVTLLDALTTAVSTLQSLTPTS